MAINANSPMHLIRKLIDLAWDELHKEFTTKFYSFEVQAFFWNLKKTPIVYWKDGRIHRDNDLPAIEHFSGEKKWLWHGKPHRERNKPAIIYADGYEECWEKGVRVK